MLRRCGLNVGRFLGRFGGRNPAIVVCLLSRMSAMKDHNTIINHRKIHQKMTKNSRLGLKTTKNSRLGLKTLGQKSKKRKHMRGLGNGGDGVVDGGGLIRWRRRIVLKTYIVQVINALTSLTCIIHTKYK